jgi:hypothetical protein
MSKHEEDTEQMNTQSLTAARARPSLVKKIAVIAVASAGLSLVGAGVAEAAAQSGTLGPGQSHSYSTWFFGRTQVCFKNVDPTYDASYYWTSGPTSSGGGLTPGAEACTTRSFVGLPINVHNLSARANIQVRFPIGP